MIRKSFLIPLFALGLLLPVVRAEDAKTATGTVSGKVTDAEGKAVSGATVGVYAPGGAKKAAGAATLGNAAVGLADEPAPAPKKKGGGGGTPVATATTDDTGAYKIENVPAGDYTVRVKSASGAGRANVTVKAGETATADITVKAKKAQ